MNQKYGFVGAGRWALCLACHLDRLGEEVALWEPNDEYRTNLLAQRRHPDLPDCASVPDSVVLSGDRAEVLDGADYVVFAVPSQSLPGAARDCAMALDRRTKAIITATKGIEAATLERLSVILQRTFPGRPVAVLAGPGIPYDFALGDPTSLVVASEDEALATSVRDRFTGANLRVYSNPDTVGVELGAALKNVYALGAGIADGLGLGINAKSALLTRGLAEMTRLGLAMNANPLTFSGLAGIGDLIVTAFAAHSRNHQLGMLIGSGTPLGDAVQSLNGVAEGVPALAAARQLARRHRIEMPIAEELYGIIHDGSDASRSINRLLRRRTKRETLD